jgi:GLPGLI family protein
MIKIIFTILLFTSFSFSQSKSGLIFYGHKINEMAIDTTKIQNDRVKNVILNQFLQKKRILSADVNVYKLSFDDKSSLFEPIKKLNSDAYNNYIKAVPEDKYYIDLKNDSIFRITNFSGNEYIIGKNNSSLKWKILEDNKIINGLKCNKASTIIENSIGVKTKVIAWYSNEIPLNFGPVGYAGLPGLIIELHLRENIYYFKSIIFKNIKVKNSFEGEHLSNEEYQNLFKNNNYIEKQ